MRRIVIRRNVAVIRYRKLAKARVAETSDRLKRLVAEHLAEIARLDAQIAELQAKPTPSERESAAEVGISAEQPECPSA